MKNLFELPLDGKGVAHDVARSSEDWNYFRKYHKANNPIRYFLHHEFESMFIWPWSMPLRRAKEWVEYRTTRRYHIIKTGMAPGYSDISEKMLHVNFNMLKNFVEKEKSHMYMFLTEHPVAKKGADAGVAYLLWEMGLEEGGWSGNKSQSENAREVYELYNWWTNERPYRLEDAHVEWGEYQSLSEHIYGKSDGFFMREDKDTPDLIERRRIWLDTANEIEASNLKEDEDMLIRLMEVRNSLWT
jgi:hypothetical protein